MKGKILTGKMLADLLGVYIQSLNHGVSLSIERGWDFVSKLECERVLNTCEIMYENYMY